MLGGILDKIRGRGGPTTVADLEETLTEGLGLPGVYKPEIVSKDGGQRSSGQKHVTLRDIDLDGLTTVGDLKSAIEDAYAEDGLSVRLVSPTDKSGVSERIHLKTLRDAVS